MNLFSLIGTLKEKEGKNIETYFSDKSKKVNISDATELEKLCDVFNCDLFDGRIDKNCISETFQDNCHKYLNDYLFTIEFGDKDDILFHGSTNKAKVKIEGKETSFFTKVFVYLCVFTIIICFILFILYFSLRLRSFYKAGTNIKFTEMM